MVVTAQDLRAAGIDIPLFVGGAALTRRFTATRIATEYGGPTFYAKDAMDGLDLANRLFNATTRDPLLDQVRAEQDLLRAGGEAGGGTPTAAPAVVAVRSTVSRTVPVPVPPDLDLHVLRNVPLSHIYPYLNLQMLLGKHLGVKGSVGRLLEQGDDKAREILGVVEALQREVQENGLMRADGLYRFYEARSSGDDLILFEGGREAARFSFPRQPGGERLCLADYARDVGQGEADYVALFAVTCGTGVRDLAERWKETGQYLKSHTLQALAIECAEAFAEMLHARLRTQWGFPDPPGTTLSDRLKAHYRGIRVSFGYPACPNLADQRLLFDLLEPGRIGLGLTEGFMMDPEASVSALVLPSPRGQVLQSRLISPFLRGGRGQGERSLEFMAAGISPRFLTLLAEERLPGKRVLDVGCGWGRLSLLLAREAACVIGLDRDPALVREGQVRARSAGLGNVEFHEVDVEREEYAAWAPDLVTAHLCASDAIIERSARALGAGCCLGMVAFHVDQWKETGKVSRFAYDESRMDAALRRAGLEPEVMEVEREVKRFASVEEGLAAAVGLEDRWKADGRWHRYIGFLESGGRTLTRSHLIVKARKP